MSQFLEAEYCYSFISIVTVTNLNFGHISFLLFINFAQSGGFFADFFFQEGMKLVGGKMYAKRKSS